MEKKSHKSTRNGNIIAHSGGGIGTTANTAGCGSTKERAHVISASTINSFSSGSKQRSSNSSHHNHTHHGHHTAASHQHQLNTHSQKQQQTQVQHAALHAASPALMLAVGKVTTESSKNTKVTSEHISNALDHVATVLSTVSPKLTSTTAATATTNTTAMRNKNEEAINDLRQRIPEIENIFDVHSRIGNGTFSTVLLGTLKKERELPEHLRRKFAIKHHIPTSHPDRIMKELQCMAKIGGTNNVVGINCCIRYNESVAFIMPYLQHDRFHDFFNKMDLAELQHYMRNLLIALRHVHKFNVIHRDVKPSNFLYNRRKRQFLLVDFGLAQQVFTTHIPTGTLESGCEQSNAPPALTSAAEGKRPRDGDETMSSKTVDGSNGSVASCDAYGGTKRLRCTAPQAEQELVGSATPHARGANSCIVGGSPFKMPLKQLNEITGAACNKSGTSAGAALAGVASSNNAHQNNNAAGGNGICEPTLGRQVKSAILGGGGGGSPASSRFHQKLRQSAGCARNANNNNNNTPESATGSNTAAAAIGGAQCADNNNAASRYNTNRNLSVANGPKCVCYGNPQVCNMCLVKKEMHASRAGTPGYRPPEVLLKYADQTTAVDIWAAGVIFLSILSSVYPFFKAPNDFVALAEMVTIFGDKTIRKTAFILDRLVTLSQKTKPLDLRKLCVRFRNRIKFSSPELLKKYQRTDGTCEVCRNCDQFHFNCLCSESSYITEPLDEDDPFPPSAYDLLYKLLEVNPLQRITADEALRHPFFSETKVTAVAGNNNVQGAAIAVESSQKKSARDKVEP
uniref:non-specific serine/threonine protein kinase n=1 Tax=Ceratitis capitata TaxID=7213 RepID=W8AK09_CERCA